MLVTRRDRLCLSLVYGIVQCTPSLYYYGVMFYCVLKYVAVLSFSWFVTQLQVTILCKTINIQHFLYCTVVLATLTKVSQKSGTVQFAISVCLTEEMEINASHTLLLWTILHSVNGELMKISFDVFEVQSHNIAISPDFHLKKHIMPAAVRKACKWPLYAI